MSTKNETPVTPEAPTQDDPKRHEVKMMLLENEQPIIVTEDVERMIHSSYELQDDVFRIDNETTFTHLFVRDAVTAALKAACNKAINDWVSKVGKAVKLPSNFKRTVEEVTQECLASRRGQALKKRADAAQIVLNKLK